MIIVEVELNPEGDNHPQHRGDQDGQKHPPVGEVGLLRNLEALQLVGHLVRPVLAVEE